MGISLAGADGNGQPVFTGKEVVFNGVAGTNCEPFIFRRIQPPRPGRNIVFEYCKTEHLPYDLAVQCCLIVFKHHLGDIIKITSDGTGDDWVNAKEVCNDILAYGNDFKLSTNE